MNIGIVGCGSIFKRHIQSLRRLRECRVVAVCDINESRADATAKRYGIPRSYIDIDQMFQQENLDIVHVLTPPQTHASVSIKAMEKGCHVLVEKPMAVTVREADSMIDVAQRNQVKLCVVHSFLFHPTVRRLIGLYEGGGFGKISRVDIVGHVGPAEERPWFNALLGGAFGEYIPHFVYTILAFLEGVKDVCCFEKESSQGLKEISVLLNAENATGSLFMSATTRISYIIHVVSITGSDMTVNAIVPTGTGIKYLPREQDLLSRTMMATEPIVHSFSAFTRAAIGFLSGSFRPGVSHERLISEFIYSVKNDREPPVTAYDGREVVRVIEMIFQRVGIISNRS